jgi:hypothetical protein
MFDFEADFRDTYASEGTLIIKFLARFIKPAPVRRLIWRL